MTNASFMIAIFVLSILFAVGIYDAYAMYANGSGDTVSTVFKTWSREWPILPFAIGVLVGHLFA